MRDDVERMITNDRRLEGKVAVVTGGSSGIGCAAARAMHASGAAVVICGRDAGKLDAAVASIGTRATGVVADVTRLADLDRLVETVERQHGRIDVLMVNAGMSHSPPLRDVDEAAFDTMIGLNFKAVFFTVARAARLLADDASIILTGSAAATMGRLGDPLYAATKAAVRSLARTLTMDEDFIARRIRVNVLSPGAVRTPLTIEAHEDPVVDAYVRAAVPMNRWGEADELGKAAVFLASSESSYMTGSVLAVDGGLAQV